MERINISPDGMYGIGAARMIINYRKHGHRIL